MKALYFFSPLGLDAEPVKVAVRKWSFREEITDVDEWSRLLTLFATRSTVLNELTAKVIRLRGKNRLKL